MKLIAATKNPGKIFEIRSLLEDLAVEIIALNETDAIPPVVEDGKIFEENAIKKAVHASRHTKFACLADDSGLEVDQLKGSPGVHSARFAGEPPSDSKNIEKLLSLMSGVPLEKRRARFRCVVALALPDGKIHTFEGRCEGLIAFEPKGFFGFGYDPVFIVPEHNMTFAELGLSVKNKISHRAKALMQLKEILPSVL